MHFHLTSLESKSRSTMKDRRQQEIKVHRIASTVWEFNKSSYKIQKSSNRWFSNKQMEVQKIKIKIIKPQKTLVISHKSSQTWNKQRRERKEEKIKPTSEQS